MLDRARSWLSRPTVWLAVPLALAAAAYARVLDASFQFDDEAIQLDLGIKDLGAFLRHGLLERYGNAQRPISALTFAVDYAIGGLDPRVFHFTNVVVHLCAVLAVWAFTRRVMRLAAVARGDWLAVAVAGVFAVHPIQSQAVSYVTQRSEALSSALYVAALLLVLAAERRGLGRRGAPLWAAALAVFLLALGAKPVAVTMPVAWLLLAATVPAPEQRAALLSWPRRLAVAVPFALVDVVFISRAIAGTTGSADAGFSVPGLPPWSYLLSQLRVLLLYLRLLFWPAGQNVDWDFRKSTRLAEPDVVFAGLWLVALVAGAIWLVRAARRWRAEDAGAARVAAFGILWFFVLLAPTSSVVPLFDLVMEHRLYLACWGVFAAVAVAVERAAARAPVSWAAPAALAAAAVAVAALSVALYQRNAVWLTPRALWTDSASKSPAKARVHMSVANALLQDGDFDGAIRASETALQVVGDDAFVEVEILRNMGAAYVLMGLLDRAEETFRRALAKDPHAPDILNNLAITLKRKGDLAGAELAARRAIAGAPGRSDPWNALGEILLARGEPAEALGAFERSVRIDPDVAVHQVNRGLALFAVGRRADACALWAALRLPPTTPLGARVARTMAEAGCGSLAGAGP